MLVWLHFVCGLLRAASDSVGPRCKLAHKARTLDAGHTLRPLNGGWAIDGGLGSFKQTAGGCLAPCACALERL